MYDPINLVDFVCCLRPGAGFGSDHVNALARQVRKKTSLRSVCVTDEDVISEVIADFDETLPFITTKQQLPFWWCILEAFRLPGPCVFVGVDTVVMGDLEPLANAARNLRPDQFIMMRPPVEAIARKRWASGVMAWKADFRWILDAVLENPEMMCDHSLRHTRTNQGTMYFEQDHTTRMLKQRKIEIIAAQDVCDGIQTYKLNGRPRPEMARSNPPDGLRLLIFHGLPRPWDAVETSPWLEQYLEMGVSV